MNTQPIKVTFFQRKSRPARNFSLEFIFDDVRSRLSEKIDATKRVAPFYSNGFFRRLGIMFHSWWHQNGVNHVTGDTTFSAIGLASEKTVLTILDCGVLARTSGWKRRVIKQLWFDWPIRKARIVTTISSSSRNEIIEITGCDPRKVRVVPVAVSNSFTRVDKAFAGDCPNILHLGTYPNKNLPRLIEALRGVKCQLTIIGKLDSATIELLEKNEIQYKNKFDVSHEEIVQHYVDADIVAFASTYEGFGMPIVEANVVGRPVITGNVCSMPEVAGNAACLVDPFDVDSIRSGIQRVICDDSYRSSLVQNGFENALRFQPDKIANMYFSVYREIAHQG